MALTDTSTVDLGAVSMTEADAARALGVAPARLSRLISDGRLEARRAGTMTLVTEESAAACASTPRVAGRPRREPVTA